MVIVRRITIEQLQKRIAEAEAKHPEYDSDDWLALRMDKALLSTAEKRPRRT